MSFSFGALSPFHARDFPHEKDCERHAFRMITTLLSCFVVSFMNSDDDEGLAETRNVTPANPKSPKVSIAFLESEDDKSTIRQTWLFRSLDKELTPFCIACSKECW
eukprot:261429-Hanusia_phi.AAC.1